MPASARASSGSENAVQRQSLPSCISHTCPTGWLSAMPLVRPLTCIVIVTASLLAAPATNLDRKLRLELGPVDLVTTTAAAIDVLLAVGRPGDLVIWRCREPAEVPYHYGSAPPIDDVFVGGA